MSLATIAAGTPRLLIVALQGLGDIVVNHITHIGLVDTHTKGDRGDNHIDPLHQEVILVGCTG